MKFLDFQIGKEFKWLDKRHICTDIGTRVIVAICVESTVITTFKDGVITKKTIAYDEIIKDGWHIGPPYAMTEIVIPKDIIHECKEIVHEGV